MPDVTQEEEEDEVDEVDEEIEDLMSDTKILLVDVT
jgi:hypothetical protein